MEPFIKVLLGFSPTASDKMLRVVRRDNNQCQTCGKVLKDDEIEFDHVIPVSKGGSSEEHNVRVACLDCNRTKSNRYDP